MILRNVAIRHGRSTLAAPISKTFLRCLNTETAALTQEREAIEGAITKHAKETSSISSNINKLHIHSQYSAPTPPKPSNRQVKKNHHLFKQIRATTASVGSVIEPYYEPHKLVVDPPRPEDVTLELLMSSQAHLGHHTSLWNPMNQRYIYGIRQGIHIISLEVTAAHLRRAAKVVEGVAYHGGLILFVGSRKGQATAIVKAAELAKGCHLFDKWIPGSLTNGSQILRGCQIQAVDKDDKIVPGFEQKLSEWKALKPDLVVVMNPLENYILLHECGLNNIPTIGVIDTDADPTWVTYPIPANDDSLRCIQVIAGVLGRAGESGQADRLQAAKDGKITWQPPPGLGKPHEDEISVPKGKTTVVSDEDGDVRTLLRDKKGPKENEFGEVNDDL